MVMTDENRKPGIGIYLAGAYIIAMYVAYYYCWVPVFSAYLAGR